MGHRVNLHESEELFKDAIQATAEHYLLQNIFIEKNYWLTLALYPLCKGTLRYFLNTLNLKLPENIKVVPILTHAYFKQNCTLIDFFNKNEVRIIF